MSKNKKQKSRIEKEIVAKTAAMFEVTSTPSEQISSLPNIDEIVDKAVIDATNKELEEMHETEINEAKELGMSDSIIVESTVNEISKDFESNTGFKLNPNPTEIHCWTKVFPSINIICLDLSSSANSWAPDGNFAVVINIPL